MDGHAGVHRAGVAVRHRFVPLGQSTYSVDTGKCKSDLQALCGKHGEQLQLVSDFRCLDESKLEGLGNIVRDVLSGSAFIGAARCETIARALEQRALLLRERICSR